MLRKLSKYKMASKFPSASHLLNDEVDYELKLRNYGDECSKTLDSKQRTLRRLLHQDNQENREYRSMYSIDQEFDLISSRVNVISSSLAQTFDNKLVSRLKHYLLRAQRSSAKTVEAKSMRESLVREILEKLSPFMGGRDGVNSSQDEGNEDLQKSDLPTAGKLSTDNQKDLDNRNQVKINTNMSQGSLELKVQNLEAQMNEIKSMLQQVLAKPLQNTQSETQPTEATQTHRTGTIPKTSINHIQSRPPLECNTEIGHVTNEYKGHPVDFRLGEVGARAEHFNDQYVRQDYPYRIPPSGVPIQFAGRLESQPRNFNTIDQTANLSQPIGNIGLGQNRHFSRFMHHDVYEGNESSESVSQHNAEMHRNNLRDYRAQYDRKIEKWNIFFSGSPRSPTLEDFIYKVKVLANMSGVPKDSLISHIHLLLRDEASNWFFTYYEANWNWDEFEMRIRYRFGNPNQDQGNRQQIYERKQVKGETFIAFVTEIERLNKLLTKPLSPQRKFEIIWENMRQHYRSKLACFQVTNLEDLTRMNYRIDASDPGLHPISVKHGVHNIAINSEEEHSDEEEINLLNNGYQRNQRFSKRQDTSGARVESSTRSPLCWNCQKNGHFWRDCREAKTTFCYVCGNPGKISTTCDSHPRREPQRGASNSQNSGN